MMNLPNILTLLRVFAAPLVPILYVLWPTTTGIWITFILFVVAALTDFLDGWLARKYNQVSAFGRMLDPIADKAMVLLALMALMGGDLGGQVLLVIPAALIILREVLISGLREFLGARLVIPVTQLAKWKTTVQMSAIALLLLAPLNLIDLHTEIGLSLLSCAAILTLLSGWDYFIKALPVLRAMDRGE